MKIITIAGLLFFAPTSRAVAADSSGGAPDRREPPAAAFEGCSGRSAGDSCTVKFRDREISGRCEAFGSDDRLICRPTDMPPGPPPDNGGAL
jgi:hypothetical protein